MTESDFMSLLQQTIWVMILLASPVLIISMLVGVLISIFQAVTQIQEATLTFVPKILVSFLVLVLTGPWMVQTMIHHTTLLFDSLIKYAH
jgi:flagellar biosynthetic protein FliQ